MKRKGAQKLCFLWLVLLAGPALAQVSVSSWQPPTAGEAKAKPKEAPPSRRYPMVLTEQVKTHRLTGLDDETQRQLKQKSHKKTLSGIVRTLPAALKSVEDVTVRQVPEGRLWLMRVGADGAAQIRIHFQDLNLPDGARLFVSSVRDPDQYAGPYTGTPSRDIWTPPIDGDEVMVEIFLPNGSAASPSFTIAEIGHVFRAVTSPLDDAAPCNIGVPPEWKEASKSVTLMQYVSGPFIFSCSGTLINSVGNTGIPYVLTANHCLNTPREANSAQFYWFYDSADTSTRQSSYGAELVATGIFGDFTLLRLAGVLPPGVKFAGWTTAMPAPSSPVAGIHHPQASYQRFSSGSAILGVCPSGIPPEFCEGFQGVRWSSGITEPGSSGSGLWTGPPSDPKVAGTLSGGGSSCDNPTAPDYYGRLDKAFPSLEFFLTGGGCSYLPEQTEKYIGSNGGSATVNINTLSVNQNCPWTATSTAPWLTVTGNAGGAGNGTITFSVTANTDPTSRLGFIRVAGLLIAVVQAGTGAGCAPVQTVTPGFVYNGNLSSSDCKSIFNTGSYADRYRLVAQAGQQNAFYVSSYSFVPQLSITAPDGTLIDLIPGGIYNEIYYTLPAAGSYIVEVTSRDPEETGNYELFIYRGCDCRLSPESAEFTGNGGTGEFNVTIPPDCRWHIEPQADWVKITAGANGLGPGKVSFSVNPATGVNSLRTADLRLVADNSSSLLWINFNVKQYLPCAYNFFPDPSSTATVLNFFGNFQLDTGSYCFWTLSSDADWISFDPYANGISLFGYRNILYRAKNANLSPNSRSATISAADKKFVVTQPGIGANCSIEPIAIGQTVQGTLREGCEIPAISFAGPGLRGRYYSFQGTEGQRITIAIGAALMNVAVHLIGPNDTLLESSPSGGGSVVDLAHMPQPGYVPERSFVYLPATGRYVIGVAGYDPDPNLQQFTLSLNEAIGTDCLFSLSSDKFWADASGSQGSIQFTQKRGSNCNWRAESTAPWLTITAGSTGSGSGTIDFTVAANPGGLRAGYLNIGGHLARIIQEQKTPLAVTSSAGYQTRVAGGSLITIFGVGMSQGTGIGTTRPLPEKLAGTTVRVATRYFNRRNMPLLYVSPEQINFYHPNYSPPQGEEMYINVVRDDGVVTGAKLRSEWVAPGLFAADGSAQGPAAALLLRIKPDNSLVYESVYEIGHGGKIVTRLLDLGPDNEQVYLVLFGTGLTLVNSAQDVSVDIGGVTLPVTYAGSQTEYYGLDQINVPLPKSLRGKGEVPVSLQMYGLTSNAVKIKL